MGAENIKKLFLFTILSVGIISGVILSPEIWAIVEPHITITMEPGQTTKPFVINDDSGTEVFSVDVDGTITPSGTSGQTFTITNGIFNAVDGQYDLTAGNFFDAFYDNSINNLIIASNEPADGVYIYTHTLTANDFASNSFKDWNYDDFSGAIVLQVKNNGGVSSSVSMRTFVNGEQVSFNPTSRSINSNFFGSFALPLSQTVSVGDTIQVKAWSSVPDIVSITKGYVATFPSKMTFTAQHGYTFFDEEDTPMSFDIGSNLSPTVLTRGAFVEYHLQSIDDRGPFALGFNAPNVLQGQFIGTFGLGDRTDHNSSDRIMNILVDRLGKYNVLR